MIATQAKPEVTCFFDEPTFTCSYVVMDSETKHAAIVDSVLDYEPRSGRTNTVSADAVIAHVTIHGLTVDWILETHVHADHLSAAPYLKQVLGGQIGIGFNIVTVQKVLGDLFNAEPDFDRTGQQFDRLLHDGDTVRIGNLEGRAMHTPGHTPACMSYVIGDACFVGDTLFMPDFGTARCDFPGGDPRQLFQSIQKVLALPADTRLFMCHDYKAPGRDEYKWETTVAEEKAKNVHVHDGVSEDAFVEWRTNRDKTLGMPRLFMPSVQVNMRGGHLPPAEDNGVQYLKIPLNTF